MKSRVDGLHKNPGVEVRINAGRGRDKPRVSWVGVLGLGMWNTNRGFLTKKEKSILVWKVKRVRPRKTAIVNPAACTTIVPCGRKKRPERVGEGLRRAAAGTNPLFRFFGVMHR